MYLLPRFLVAFLLVACSWAQAAETRPNIVLIYADDLGYGDVGCYGAKRVATPNIDRLAKEGLRFTDAHATSATCTPSRYALLTGEYPWRRKGTGILPGDAGLIIEPGRRTLPAMLKEAGYVTGIVGKWHLGLGRGGIDWNSEIKPGPLDVGFDSSFIMAATGDRVPCVYVDDRWVFQLDQRDGIIVSYQHPVGSEPTGKTHPELLKLRPSHGHNDSIVNGVSRIGFMTGGREARWDDEEMADVYLQRAIKFIERQREKPFFLYLATHDVHVPRIAHPRFQGKSEMGPRGDVILQLDWVVGQVIDVLEKHGLTEKTLIVFSSDNGPVVDDGYLDEAVAKLGDHKPAGPWRGGKYSVYEGGTRVPFIVRWPGRVKPGVSDALVSQVDLLASFAELSRQSVDATVSPDSQNMLAALLGDSAKGRAHLVEHSGGLAVRSGSWKFVEKRNGRGELYDLATDPAEAKDLAADQPDRVKELTELLQAERAKGERN